MINFKELGDGTILALQDNNDGSNRVVAKVDASHTQPRKDPVLHNSWEVIDDKLNSVCKIAFSQALAVAYAALIHAAVIKDLLHRPDITKPD